MKEPYETKEPGQVIEHHNLHARFAGQITLDYQRRQSDFKWSVVVFPGALATAQGKFLVPVQSGWFESINEALASALYKYIEAVA